MVERALPLEVEHGVHHVLERLGAGDSATLGHVTDEEYRRARGLREPHQPCGALPHLAHVARRALELLRVGGLDRVHEHDAAAQRPRVVQDRLESSLAEHVHSARVHRQPVSAQPDLVRRLLPGHIQGGNPSVLESRGALEQQRGLPDAGLAAHQDDGAGDDAAAEHVVELVEAGLPPLHGPAGQVGETGRWVVGSRDPPDRLTA